MCALRVDVSFSHTSFRTTACAWRMGVNTTPMLSKDSVISRWLLTLFLVAMWMQTQGKAQNLGSAPQLRLNGSDLYSSFRLSVRDNPANPAWVAAMELQVGERARKLGLTKSSALRAREDAQKLLVSSPASAVAREEVIFDGTTASTLNQILSTVQNTRVRVVATRLRIDQPIHGIRDGTTLDQESAAFLIRIEGAHGCDHHRGHCGDRELSGACQQLTATWSSTTCCSPASAATAW